MNTLLPAWTLFKRETTRFLRQKNRVAGALGTPLVFWFLIGSGLNKAFRLPGSLFENQIGYLNYFFPGTIVLILFFTAIFSTISLIDDRREGFLQGVLVAPVSRSAIVWGNLMGGTVLATGQGILFLLLIPFLGLSIDISHFLLTVAAMAVMSMGLTGLGFNLAWRMETTQGFHAVMNLFLMPLWLLSGALFPVASAPSWLKIVMLMNPLTYSVAALQQGLLKKQYVLPFSISPYLLLLIVSLFSLIMFAWGVKTVQKPIKGQL